MEPPEQDVSAIVVAFGAEPCLEPGVRALLASLGVRVEVVLVDNGCTDGAVDRLEGTPGLVVVRPAENLGFAGGCNAGADVASGNVLALVNPDAIAHPDALAVLAEGAARPGVGLVTASVRLADRPTLLNSAGNEIHFGGLSWSGHFEEQAADHECERDVLAASGAAMAIRLDLWRELDGFDDRFFAYYEDADLSLRCWLRGLRVVYLPAAVVEHRYEFSRNPAKFFLLERNRAVMVWSCYSRRLLLVTAPVLLLLEVATLAMSIAQGWLRHKLNAWRWLWANRHYVHARRSSIQATRVVGDRALAPMFATRLNPGNLPPPAWTGPLDRALSTYWAFARRLL
ncbi:MAG: glycosyltransferase family 2 protein [Acidimicrobiales bacterium]